jgi:monoamine oxidase
LQRREFLQGFAASTLALALGANIPATPRRAKVLVVGAGLSGMVAALELKNAGFEVIVLEGNSRPGGRVHTLREPFSDGLYAEAGAGRIPSTHDLTLKYVRQFNLQLVPFYPTSGAEVYFIKGKRQRVDATHPLDMSQVDLSLTAEERRIGLSKWEAKYMDDAQHEVGRVPSKDWPSEAVLKAYGSISIQDFLRARGASDDAIEMLVSGYQSEAALDFLRDLASHQAPMLSKIVGGNDLLPKAFAAKLSENIFYGARVVRMEQTGEQVKVSFIQGGMTRAREADYIICAIPFTVLRGIDVSPAFSDEKRHAIEAMTYGAVSRVFLQTRTKFWRKEGNTGFATVDRAMEIWNPTWNQSGRRGLLMAYAYEHLAREIAAQAPSDRVTAMLDYFDQVHPGAKDNFEVGASWVWDEQPFTKGAYCVYQPGEMNTILPAAMRPEKRILFAGEHCSSHPAWMQGALESGLRAAEMIQHAN